MILYSHYPLEFIILLVYLLFIESCGHTLNDATSTYFQHFAAGFYSLNWQNPVSKGTETTLFSMCDLAAPVSTAGTVNTAPYESFFGSLGH